MPDIGSARSKDIQNEDSRIIIDAVYFSGKSFLESGLYSDLVSNVTDGNAHLLDSTTSAPKDNYYKKTDTDGIDAAKSDRTNWVIYKFGPVVEKHHENSVQRVYRKQNNKTTQHRLLLLHFLTEEKEYKNEQNKAKHHDDCSTAHPPRSPLRSVVGISSQDETREFVVLEGTNIHLCVLVDQGDALTLVEQTELVDTVHVRSANDLPIIPSPLHYRRVIPVVAGGVVGKSLPHVWVQHHELDLYIVRLRVKPPSHPNSVRLPLLSVELLDVDGVVQFVLNAVHHVVASDLRLRITTP